MKKILSFLLLAVITVGVVSCKGKVQNKTTAKTEQHPQGDSMSVAAQFKNQTISNMERYIKRWVSSDPDFGRVINTYDVVLNDTFYFARYRVVYLNDYGAKKQYDNLWSVFCRRDTSDVRALVWPDKTSCTKGINYMINREHFPIDFCVKVPDFQFKIMDALYDNPLSTLDELLK